VERRIRKMKQVVVTETQEWTCRKVYRYNIPNDVYERLEEKYVPVEDLSTNPGVVGGLVREILLSGGLQQEDEDDWDTRGDLICKVEVKDLETEETAV
jgi:hypothetical protein